MDRSEHSGPSPDVAPLLAIVGPTGAGKSALALALARRHHGEIVNADSRQVYRGMNVGTAKPSAEDRAGVPHHLYDVADPDDEFSLAHFLRLARDAIAGVHHRDALPVLVGGTGQYAWALLEGWETPHAPPQPGLRAELTALAERDGHAALHRRLERVDPEAAARIEPRNVRRVVRALEVHAATGVPLAQARGKRPPPYDALVLGLDAPSRAELHRRLDARVERMLADGWVDEVRRILASGYSPGLPSLSSMGYRELARHLAGEITLEEARRQIRTAHHRLARRQYAWFKPADPRIRWLLADGTEQQQAQRVLAGWMSSVGRERCALRQEPVSASGAE